MSGRPRNEPLRERAERLHVALLLCLGAGTLDPRKAVDKGWAIPIPAASTALLGDADEQDLALINACLQVEAELRERSYAAVEQLLSLVAGREGELPRRINALPDREAAYALCDLYEVGWIY